MSSEYIEVMPRISDPEIQYSEPQVYDKPQLVKKGIISTIADNYIIVLIIFAIIIIAIVAYVLLRKGDTAEAAPKNANYTPTVCKAPQNSNTQLPPAVVKAPEKTPEELVKLLQRSKQSQESQLAKETHNTEEENPPIEAKDSTEIMELMEDKVNDAKSE